MRSHNNTNTVSPIKTTAGGDEVQPYYLFNTEIACYCVISVVGSLANVVICMGLLRGNRLKSSEHFILNLAIADLLVCVFGIPLDIYLKFAGGWPYGPFLCHVIYPLQTCLILISILTLMAMSLERHRAIRSPLKQRVKTKWLRCSIVCIWLIAIAAVVPYAKILKYSDSECLEIWPVPDNAKYYTLALFIMDYCIPLTIITYCYTRAGYVLYTEFKKLNEKESTSSRQEFAIIKRLQQKKKVIKIFSFAVILFVICVLPGDCYWMWFSFRTIKSHPLDVHLRAFSTLTLYANSAINPFIFGAFKMIRQRNLKSRFGDQLSSTTNFSVNRIVSSARMGEGLNRNLFSRTPVQKHIKYKNFKTKNRVRNASGHVGGEVELTYRDISIGFRNRGQGFGETHKKPRKTNFNPPVMEQKICDIEQEMDDMKQEIDDMDQRTRLTNYDAKKGRIKTNTEMRDTKQQQLDTNDEMKCREYTSNDILHDARSVLSDCSGTLYGEEDDTNCTQKERTGSSDCQCYITNEYQEDEGLHKTPNKTNKLKQDRLESSKLVEHDLSEANNGTKQDDTDTEMKMKDENFKKLCACEKDINSDFSESTASRLDKIAHNLLEFIQSRSVKESDV